MAKQHQFRHPHVQADLPLHSKATSPGLTPLSLCTSHGLWASPIIWAGKLMQKKNMDFFFPLWVLMKGNELSDPGDCTGTQGLSWEQWEDGKEEGKVAGNTTDRNMHITGLQVTTSQSAQYLSSIWSRLHRLLPKLYTIIYSMCSTIKKVFLEQYKELSKVLLELCYSFFQQKH